MFLKYQYAQLIWATWLAGMAAPAALSDQKTPPNSALEMNTKSEWHYVAPAGTQSGDGTINQPWSLNYALGNTGAVRPGDTVWILGGEYSGCIVSRLEGNSAQSVSIRQQPGEHSVLASNEACAPLTIEGGHVEISGLHFRGTGQNHPALVVNASQATIRNNVFERTGGIAASAAVIDLDVTSNAFLGGRGPIEGTRLRSNVLIDYDSGLAALGGGAAAGVDVLVAGNTVIGSTTGREPDSSDRRVHWRDNRVGAGSAAYSVFAGSDGTGSAFLAVPPGRGGDLDVTFGDVFSSGQQIEIRSVSAVNNEVAFRGAYSGLGVRLPVQAAGTTALYVATLISPPARLVEEAAGTKLRLAAASSNPALTALDLPLQIPGLQLWFRADAGITQSGGTVSQWSNQFGSGTAATQTTASHRPKFIAQAVNGKPALQFDGINDRLRFTLPVNGLSELTIVLVSANLDNENGGPDGRENAAICWPENSGWGTVHLSPFRSAVRMRFGTGGPNNLPSYTRPTPLQSGFSLTSAVKKGTQNWMYVNGSQVLVNSGQWNLLGGNSSTGQLGEGAPAGQNFFGQIAEVLVFNRALTDTDRVQVERYLSDKYFGSSPNTAPVAINQTIQVVRGMPATVRLSGTDADGSSLLFSVIQSPAYGTLAGTAPSLTYTAGSNSSTSDTLRFRVSDGSGGTADGTITFQIVAAATLVPPVARISVDRSTGTVPVTIRFDGSASTATSGENIVAWDWDFGDNTKATGAVVDHLYLAGGSRTVRLTVSSSNGLAGSATLAFVLAAAPATSIPGTVDISPGANIQQTMNSYPAGTSYRLRAGVHRMQQIVPKAGDTIAGEAGAILNGSRVLTSFTQQGSYWVASGQTQENVLWGVCVDNAPRCNAAEDVFVDGVRLAQAGSLGNVAAGSFYFDYPADKIYLGTNPAGRTVEAAVTQWAVSSNAANVTLRDVIVEKYANRAQAGAVNGVDGANWTIERVESRFNHGVGIVVGSGGRILTSKAHHNGQLGMAAVGKVILLKGNEIAYNNTAGFESGWEAGGTKFALTEDLTVSDNYVHHNEGPGLWTDIDNLRTIYENNRVEDNGHAGIFHEISYDAVIRNNIVLRNGTAFGVWLWGAQIQIAGSRNVEVHNNTVTVSAQGGNGIALIQQNRGSGKFGTWLTRDNWVHDNVVIYEGAPGMSGAVADDGEAGMVAGGNRFDRNTYKVLGDQGRFFWGREVDWVGLRQLGQELSGLIQ